MSFTWGAPTPAQTAAIRTARTIGALQAAELVRLQRRREEVRLPSTPEIAVLEVRALAGVQLLYGAYRQLHRAYGGLAPTSVIKPIVEAYYERLGTAPDAGEWPT